MSKKTKIITSLFLLTTLLFIAGCGCKKTNTSSYKLNLEIWGLFDDSYAYSEIIENYKKINPAIISINYKKLTPDTYEKELLDALAAGKGPDIFLIRNTWTNSFADKIAPSPKEVLTEQKFKTDFVDVVAQDFISGGQVYAMPLSVDSLALYYNKDLFNEAGIATLPNTWEEFKDDVRKLTKIDQFGNITQSGAAIGTAYNINRSTDILNLLMLQSGTTMVNDTTKQVAFNNSSGENALNFYTQFAKSSSPYYSWNPRLHYSVDAFSEGTLAMMFNYSWQIDTLRSKAPKLNFDVAPVPQFPDGTRTDFANYWGFTVTKNKDVVPDPNATYISANNQTRILEAWKFLKYLTTVPEGKTVSGQAGGTSGQANSQIFDPAAKFLEKNKKPAARRDLAQAQQTDTTFGVFAKQNLLAKSWEQDNPNLIESVMAEMIDKVNSGALSANEALKSAVVRINQQSSK